MNKLIRQAVAFTALALLSAASYAGIAATKHNLSSSGTGPNKTSDTTQICVFCHTPHGSDTSAAVPLWNKKLPASNTYSVYNSTAATATSSLDGEVLAVGSVSLACLSCHDGSQAMDNIINAPGSGGYDSTGGGANGLGYTWTSTGTNIDTATGKMLTTNPIPGVGTDLKNDHPVGIEYCGGGLSAGTTTTVTGTCADTDFISATVKTKQVNSQQVFWVDVDDDGNREKTDIALYTRDFTGASATPSVECASCHDPHVEDMGAGSNVDFMRVTLAGSQICLACHVK